MPAVADGHFAIARKVRVVSALCRRGVRLARAALAVFIISMISGSFVAAEPTLSEVRIGDLRIQDVRVTEVPASAKNALLFMTIVHDGEDADRLISVQTARADRSQLMTMRMDGGLMRMVMQTEFSIAPNTAIRLKATGQHVMLMGLTAPLRSGETFMVVLEFANSGTVEVVVVVTARHSAS